MEMASAALANSPSPGLEMEAAASYLRVQELLNKSKASLPVSPLDELSESARARLETYK